MEKVQLEQQQEKAEIAPLEQLHGEEEIQEEKSCSAALLEEEQSKASEAEESQPEKADQLTGGMKPI
jgi:hypothetical protein